jgi:plasmid maintenance system antidote protein VapI
LRAAIARARIPIYLVAAELRFHPSSLSVWLNERRPLEPDVAIRIAAAIKRLARGDDAA